MGDSAFIRRTRYWRAGCTKTCPSGSGGGGWIPLATRGWPPTSSQGVLTWSLRSIRPKFATRRLFGTRGPCRDHVEYIDPHEIILARSSLKYWSAKRLRRFVDRCAAGVLAILSTVSMRLGPNWTPLNHTKTLGNKRIEAWRVSLSAARETQP